MARPREFETEDALDGAMDVFWRQGYGDASLSDLLDGMGITRGSLYKAFGDKKRLFLQVLKRYEGAIVTPAVDLLSDSTLAPRDRVTAMFNSIVDAVRGGDRLGCMMCSVAASSAMHDEEIAAEVNDLMDQMRGGFRATGASDAEVEMMLSHYVGLRVLARSGASPEMMSRSVDGLLASLRM